MNTIGIKNRLLLIVVMSTIFILACIEQESKSSTEKNKSPDVDLLTAVASTNIDIIEEHINMVQI